MFCSQAASDFSDSNIGSPARRLSELPGLLPEEPLVPGSDAERDFFSHLYSGDLGGDGTEGIPEDYYNYLEGWYRAQKSLQPPLISGGGGVAGGAGVAGTPLGAGLGQAMGAAAGLPRYV